ncbi:putative RiPP precursor [Mesorhizobium ciceri]|nr:putative RiPP precursor [Mesorhizobium ciceri]
MKKTYAKTYAKPTFVKKGKLSAVTANGPSSVTL